MGGPRALYMLNYESRLVNKGGHRNADDVTRKAVYMLGTCISRSRDTKISLHPPACSQFKAGSIGHTAASRCMPGVGVCALRVRDVVYSSHLSVSDRVLRPRGGGRPPSSLQGRGRILTR